MICHPKYPIPVIKSPIISTHESTPQDSVSGIDYVLARAAAAVAAVAAAAAAAAPSTRATVLLLLVFLLLLLGWFMQSYCQALNPKP